MADNVEIWRCVQGFEDKYAVSNMGRVKSLQRVSIRMNHGKKTDYPIQEKILAPLISNGYHSVVLCKNGEHIREGIHRLVARAFPEICGEWFEGSVVNHKDENPENNVATNLETCTIGYNDRYGNRIDKISKKNRRPVVQLTTDGELVKRWDSLVEAETILGVSNISSCCSGKRKAAGGYVWKYC